jgi:hypothetical protein
VESPPSVTDARLRSTTWPVGTEYVVQDGIDRYDVSGGGWLALSGQPQLKEDGGKPVVRDGRTLPIAHTWARVIRDGTPDLNPRNYWLPSARKNLADELADLSQADEERIVAWVRANGFIGVRANPGEYQESIEEIREACARLAQARAILDAIRVLKGDELRSAVEYQLNLRPGFFAEMQRDPTQPMGALNLARTFGLQVPEGDSWPGAGSYLQAMYGLLVVLDTPIRRLASVGLDVVPTADGMRIQGQLIGIGPLAAAYLSTLDEATWPAVAYQGSVLRLDWRAPRRCRRCGATFRPARRDQKWCSRQCRWAASKAGAARS